MVYHSESSGDTIRIARELAAGFSGGEIIVLNGNLGAGKTTFTKGIALGLNINDVITSPTFTIMNEYNGRLKLYHYDMYRIEREEEIEELGVQEYLYKGGVAVIEWNKFDLSRSKVINVTMQYISENVRRIEIE